MSDRDSQTCFGYLYASADPVNVLDPRGREGEDYEDLAGRAADEVENEEAKLKTLERYKVQQAWGVEEGQSAEDGVPGNNIDTTGSKEFLKMLYRSLEDLFSDDDE